MLLHDILIPVQPKMYLVFSFMGYKIPQKNNCLEVIQGRYKVMKLELTKANICVNLNFSLEGAGGEALKKNLLRKLVTKISDLSSILWQGMNMTP